MPRSDSGDFPPGFSDIIMEDRVSDDEEERPASHPEAEVTSLSQLDALVSTNAMGAQLRNFVAIRVNLLFKEAAGSHADAWRTVEEVEFETQSVNGTTQLFLHAVGATLLKHSLHAAECIPRPSLPVWIR